ncbi:hypothetical protein J6590_100975, partial [Homalodisca vitripennis]
MADTTSNQDLVTPSQTGKNDLNCVTAQNQEYCTTTQHIMQQGSTEIKRTGRQWSGGGRKRADAFFRRFRELSVNKHDCIVRIALDVMSTCFKIHEEDYRL